MKPLPPEALAAWRAALGDEQVVVDPPALQRAGSATFATTQRVAAVLRPASTAQVQACLRTATAHGVPVHPVSRGRNWGLGSRVPPVDGSVLLDLGRMDRILAFDEDLACITVEPGVTSASSGTPYMDFMRAHLAEGLQGTVTPNYTLSKSQTIRRIAKVFAMAAGAP